MQKQSKLRAAIIFKHDFLGKYPTKQKNENWEKGNRVFTPFLVGNVQSHRTSEKLIHVASPCIFPCPKLHRLVKLTLLCVHYSSR